MPLDLLQFTIQIGLYYLLHDVEVISQAFGVSLCRVYSAPEAPVACSPLEKNILHRNIALIIVGWCFSSICTSMN